MPGQVVPDETAARPRPRRPRSSSPEAVACRPWVPSTIRRSPSARRTPGGRSAGTWCHRRPPAAARRPAPENRRDRKSTRLNSSHPSISYAVFCLKKKKKNKYYHKQKKKKTNRRNKDKNKRRT